LRQAGKIMPGKIFPCENKFLAQTMKFGLKNGI